MSRYLLYNDTNATLYSSSDGAIWVAKHAFTYTYDSGSMGLVSSASFVYGDGKFVFASGDDVEYSSDAITWTKATH